MRDELKADLETQNIEYDRPAFHRIGFEDASIYLTKTCFNDARGWDHGRNLKGNYYLFNWTDWRAKGILGFELGDESPALGRAILIGDYTPANDDIRDVKYSTNNGKAYFKSALAELEGKVLDDDSSIKIDAENFMKMKEIIPTGAQGKAIYGEGDYIIDGPAGTGKSTTVLQKIKLLEIHDRVEPSSIQVIVKNSKVVNQFKQLLQSIEIEEVSILPVNEFIKNNYTCSPDLTVTELVILDELALRASEVFLLIFDIKSIFSASYKQNSKHWKDFCDLTKNNESFFSVAEKFLNKAREIREKKKADSKTIATKHAELKESIEQYKHQLISATIERNKKSLLRKLGKRIGFGFSKSDNQLSLQDEANIRQQVDKFRSNKQKTIDTLKVRSNDKLRETEQSLAKQLNDIKMAYVAAICTSQKDNVSQEVLRLYFNKRFFNDYQFHTVIIDEAQDVSAIDIELIRLSAQNTILAGDESQTENPNGLGRWDQLAIKNSFSGKIGLKVFQLRHNFRQTYELGNVSYNYRQLLLNRTVEDIKSDYFEDQIGFNKPSFKVISEDQDFVDLVKDRIQYINKSFSQPIPLVIFYENSSSLDRFQSLLGNESFNICADDSINSDFDILFVNIWQIAGREFPVLLAPLTESTNPNTIYIMLSRAKFDLTFFTGAGKQIDRHINTLCQQGLIHR